MKELFDKGQFSYPSMELLCNGVQQDSVYDCVSVLYTSAIIHCFRDKVFAAYLINTDEAHDRQYTNEELFDMLGPNWHNFDKIPSGIDKMLFAETEDSYWVIWSTATARDLIGRVDKTRYERNDIVDYFLKDPNVDYIQNYVAIPTMPTNWLNI